MTNQKRANHSLEFKQSSARLAVESEQPIAQAAEELGLKPSTLYSWVSSYGKKPLKASGPKNEIEIENARLKQERDILKKATAYFANETR